MILLFHDDNDVSITSMTNENVSYPKSNLITKYTKQVAKATTNTTTIVFTSAKCDDMWLINTNAISGTYSLSVGGTVQESGNFDFTVVGNTTLSLSGINSNIKNQYVKFDEIYSSATITITLTADSGQYVQLGVLMCGQGAYYGGTQADSFQSLGENSVSFTSAMTRANLNTLYYEMKKNDITVAYAPHETWDDASQFVGYGEIYIKSADYKQGDYFLVKGEIR